MRILVNGEFREAPTGQTVAELLEELGLQPRYLAVERNRVLIPRRKHSECKLAEGDEVEIVTLVGGG